MKTWKLLLAVVAAMLAVFLVTSLVIAAPGSTSHVEVNDVFDSPILTNTVPFTHPVGNAIALYFHIPYTQVMALHAEGFGFGEIARAYLTANASNGALTPEQVLDLRRAGVGWGQITKEYGIHPGGHGLGSIMGNKPAPEPAAPASPEVKPGHNSSSSCPGNSCNAPGQQKQPKSKPTKTPKN
ncbi:MAG TPA: hypothetical protein VMP08_05665 [Anaerolineae bacterium]|nr:hypothetical protein [Anaerolineae bacterium]